MSLPLNIVQLKRKRNQEPADFLVVQRESEELGERSPKRLVNFARVRDGESERYPTLLAGPLDGQSTSSSGAVTDAGHEPKGPELSTSAGKQNETPGSSRSDSFVLPVRTRREPRRYKVVKESSWSGLGVLRGSIEKRRQVPRSQPAGSSVAILTEKSLRGSRSPAKASKSAVELPVETPVEPKAEPGPATRRPNATAEEREWRAQNWTRNQPGENQPGEASVPRDKSVNSALTSTPEDHDSLRLAAELQKFAVEETSGGSLLPQTTAPSTTKMKYQPQRGAHRPQASNIASSSAGGKLEDLQHAARDVTMQDVSNLQSDDDWVVDTFIRQSEGIDASAVATSSSSTFQGATAGTGNYDVLVITQSDEETYGLMDEGRDEEDMDDSDDENAETNAANDYPDESDDEEMYGNDSENSYGSADSYDVGISRAPRPIPRESIMDVEGTYNPMDDEEYYSDDFYSEEEMQEHRGKRMQELSRSIDSLDYHGDVE